MWAGTTQGYEYQEVGLIGVHLGGHLHNTSNLTVLKTQLTLVFDIMYVR